MPSAHKGLRRRPDNLPLTTPELELGSAVVTVTNNQRTQDHDPTKPSTGAGCLHALPPPLLSSPHLPPPQHARTNAHTTDRIHAHERTHTARTRWLDLPLVPSGQSLAHTRPRRPTSGCWLTPVLSRTPDYSAQTRATRTAATQMGKLQFTWELITEIPYSTFLPTPLSLVYFRPTVHVALSIYILYKLAISQAIYLIFRKKRR